MLGLVGGREWTVQQNSIFFVIIAHYGTQSLSGYQQMPGDQMESSIKSLHFQENTVGHYTQKIILMQACLLVFLHISVKPCCDLASRT